MSAASDHDERTLLGLVDADRERRCREARDTASAEARTIVADARHEASARVRRAIHAMRERRRTALEASSAELATEARLAGQRARLRFLDAAWPRLSRLLLVRWERPTERRAWIDAVVEQALASILGTSGWTIVHPPTLDPGELASSIERVRREASHDVLLRGDPKLVAGLRVHGDHVTIDASIAGLLADRSGIEGRLLVDLVGEAP